MARILSSSKEFRKEFGLRDCSVAEGARVELEDPDSIQIEGSVRIAGYVKIGRGVRIEAFVSLQDCEIGANSLIRSFSVVSNSVCIGTGCTVGPGAFIRDHVVTNSSCLIGSNAEVARSEIGSRVKISHYCFVGDSKIQDDVILGAGVVTANYKNGVRSLTSIGCDTLVGCNAVIIAPVTIGSNCIIGAGEVVTDHLVSGSKFSVRF